MNVQNFQFYRTPRILFGPGQRKKTGGAAAAYGKNTLVINGAESLNSSGMKEEIWTLFEDSGLKFNEYQFSGEPSPEMIDEIVKENLNVKIDVVIGIGGGSVIDAGKAVSAMLTIGEPVEEFLEVAGTKNHPGSKVPFIAMPTTSGTGSEASANAVLSRTGPEGFKRSLRHPNFVPDLAIVDPELTISCPSKVTAACGLDALTQLIESYVSPKASPFTDALVESALPEIRGNLLKAAFEESENIEVRTSMSYSSLISGITLANAGLGVVHGIASAIGALSPIPHGVVCGTLLKAATEKTIEKLQSLEPSSEALRKYARAGFLLNDVSFSDTETGLQLLIRKLEEYTEHLGVPLLSEYGIKAADLDTIIRNSRNKDNPVKLDAAEMREIIRERIAA